jgi:GTP-binding protein
MAPLFDTMLSHVPANQDDPDAPAAAADQLAGLLHLCRRIGVGRISQGTLRVNQEVLVMEGPGRQSVQRQGATRS